MGQSMSDDGVTLLAKDEGSIDGVYNDPSGYATFGVGHLVHVQKYGSFLLAAAQTKDTWKAKIGTAYGTVKYLQRSAVSLADWKDLRAKAVELAGVAILKKTADKLTDDDKKGAPETAVKVEEGLMARTVTDVLKEDLPTYESFVDDQITIDLTQEEFDALVSLCFNIGTPNFTNCNVVKKVNDNKWKTGDKVAEREAAITAVETAFAAWNKSGGQVLAGLTTRRANESARFLKAARAEVAEMKKKPVTPPAAAAAGGTK
ncbi:MAG: lysozyme [Gemmatimonadales bacterium]